MKIWSYGPRALLDRLSLPAGYQIVPLDMQAGLIAAEAARLIEEALSCQPWSRYIFSAPKLGPARQTG